jgi:hypothetical protein
MKTLLFLPILCVSIVSFSQKSPKSIETDLKRHFEKIWYWDEHHEMNDTIDTYDSMQRANAYILHQIIKQGYNNRASLTYPFTALSQYLDVITSKDKSFRIYSWDTYTGGTMHIFYSVAQYLGSDNKVYTQSFVDNSEGDPGLWYSEIYTFNDKGKKYYFCIGHGKYSTMDLAQEIDVYTVKGNRLVQSPIIKTQKRLTSSIHVSYYLPTVENPVDNSIVFDETRNELKIPLVDAKEKMTNRYIIYKFTGDHFERTGIK